MGRKRVIGTPQGDEKLLAILDAAAAVFMKLGFASTSLEDISDSYGATKGVIYYHFRSKAALFFAVQRRAMELTRAAIEGPSRGEGPARARLQAMAHAHAMLMMEQLPYLRVAAQGLELHLSGRTSEDERKELAGITALRDGNEKIYVDVIQAGIDAGEFRPADPRLCVKPLLGAINWTSRWYQPRARESAADRQRIADEIARFAVNGLTAERRLALVR